MLKNLNKGDKKLWHYLFVPYILYNVRLWYRIKIQASRGVLYFRYALGLS